MAPVSRPPAHPSRLAATTACWTLMVLLAGHAAWAGDPTPAQLQWIREHALPFRSADPAGSLDDLLSLKAAIGDARIVALGEGTHGTREFFQMKHRLVRLLAEELGFTIFSIEANLPEAYRLNDYVLHGRGDPRALIAGMHFWTWNTEEVLAMVEWMRAYNASGRGRIEFTGFDMQFAPSAMDNVVAFLGECDPEYAEEVDKQYAALRKAAEPRRRFGVATATFPVEAARGRKLRYSGWIRTEALEQGFAGLWWRCDGPEGALAFDNMQRQAIRGTRDWREYVLELTIPNETVNINFGILHTGVGKAWFDGLRIELDGKPYDANALFGVGFEEETPRGFHCGGIGYSVATDADVAKEGDRSLRMVSQLTNVQDPAADRVAADRCVRIVKTIESRAEQYRQQRTAAEVAAAIQHARVAQQCFEMKAGRMQRDTCMARNVEWILEQAPPGTRIVLWAHNGHVARGNLGMAPSMGRVLADRFGKDYLVVGFTSSAGTYTARARKGGLRSDLVLDSPATGSIEHFFRKSGLERFVLDLRPARASDPGSEWLTKQLLMRSIGALEMSYEFSPHTIPDEYDLMIHFEQSTASRGLWRQRAE